MIRLTLSLSTLLAATAGAMAEECRTIEFAPKRLACYDKEAEFQNAIQQSIAVHLRLAQHAASECGFVIDADRFKMRLVVADLTWMGIFGDKLYSPKDLQQIGDDAQFGRGTEYCDKAWSDYGPDASLPDDVFFRCRSKASCAATEMPGR